MLAEANAIGNSEITAGTTLKVPDVGQHKNDAVTFKPYNPADTIGNTSPTLPYIPAPEGPACWKIVVMMVVIIVVTYFTAGAATEATGSMMIGAFAGGVAGSVAGQLVGKQLGIVDHFSLREAVASGITSMITAGITAGMGEAINGSRVAAAAVKAALNSVAGYIGNKIAGVPDTHFSWKTIAASAVANFVTTAVLGDAPSEGAAKTGPIKFSLSDFRWSDVAEQFGRAMFSKAVHAAAEVAITGKSVGDNDIGMVMADAFGTALGQAVIAGSVRTADRTSKGMTKAQYKALEQTNATFARLTKNAKPQQADAFGSFDLDSALDNLEWAEKNFGTQAETTGSEDLLFSWGRDGNVGNPLTGNLPYSVRRAPNQESNIELGSEVAVDSTLAGGLNYLDPSSKDWVGYQVQAQILKNSPEDIAKYGYLIKDQSVGNAAVAREQAIIDEMSFFKRLGLELAAAERPAGAGLTDGMNKAQIFKRGIDFLPNKMPAAVFVEFEGELKAFADGKSKLSIATIAQYRDANNWLYAAYLPGEANPFSKFSQREVAYLDESALRRSNSMDMALLGPMALPGLITRWMGGTESQVKGANDTMGLVTQMLSSAEAFSPKIIRPAGGVKIERGGILRPTVNGDQLNRYVALVKSNKPWRWSEVGKTISEADRELIRNYAKAQGLVTKIPVDPKTRIADFSKVAIRTEVLPKDLWKASDNAQFQYLDKLIGGKMTGTTWHHTEQPGVMQLVPFGIHNATNHAGGRTTWAPGKR